MQWITGLGITLQIESTFHPPKGGPQNEIAPHDETLGGELMLIKSMPAMLNVPRGQT